MENPKVNARIPRTTMPALLLLPWPTDGILAAALVLALLIDRVFGEPSGRGSGIAWRLE